MQNQADVAQRHADESAFASLRKAKFMDLRIKEKFAAHVRWKQKAHNPKLNTLPARLSKQRKKHSKPLPMPNEQRVKPKVQQRKRKGHRRK